MRDLSSRIAKRSAKAEASRNEKFSILSTINTPEVGNADEKPVENPDKLQVLIDPDAARLMSKLYAQYVSEEDYSELVMFIKDFDALLAKYRKEKPLSKEEIRKIEKEENMSQPSDEEVEEGDEEEEVSDEEVEEEEEVLDKTDQAKKAKPLTPNLDKKRKEEDEELEIEEEEQPQFVVSQMARQLRRRMR